MSTKRTKVSFAFGTAVAALLLLSPALASDAQQANASIMSPAAGPRRPANVPDGYVVTPFGYFHSSCVQSLAKGERLLPDGRVQHADGSAEENVAVCGYPHYTRSGVPVNAGSTQTTKKGVNTSPEINGWIESAGITTGSAHKSYGAIAASWPVPPQPSADDGQVLFFFPGFEDINNTQSILQPVLQWNQGKWTMASWNCCLNGITTRSPIISVTTGDLLYGSITSTCPRGTLTCATWNVLSVDLSTGKSTALNNTPSDGQTFNWAFSGVLEPYYVISCEDYPSNRQLIFLNLIFNQDLQRISNVKWTRSFDSKATPQCGYRVTGTTNKITLDY